MSAPDHPPSGPLFRWLWRGYMARHWPALVAALILMAVEGASLALFAAMMAPMFDDIFVQGRSEAIWFVGAVIMGIFIVRALTSMGQRIVLATITERSAARMRADLLAHLMTLDGRFHMTHPPGLLIERVQGDVTGIRTVWTAIVTGLGRDLVAVVSLFGVALAVDWRWTLIALVGIPLLIAPSLFVQRYVRARAGAARAVAADMATRLDEVFHGLVQIKLNRLEGYQSARYARLLRQRIRTETRAVAGQSAMPALIDVMTGIGFLGVLWWGGSEIVAGDKTVGQFMSFFTAMSLAFEPLRRLGNLSGLWQTAAASIARLKAIMDERPALTVPARPLPPPQGAPEIVFDRVSLAYDGRPVLDGLSFVAAAGARTAIVGPSGAGKSTVFNLLTRLVDPDAGRITIGGTDIRDMDPGALRDLFAVVTQDPALFDETLRDNILLGRGDVDPAHLAQVLADAQVAPFLDLLPRGLETPVGPRGSALSGGQRQRVAIARALLRDRPILLLDEATSALDSASEAAVDAALTRLATGRTTLVIAHRLSTVAGADRILVLDRGRLVEEGRHADLIAAGGAYAALHALQFRDEG